MQRNKEWECKTQAFAVAGLVWVMCGLSIYLAAIKRELNKPVYTLIINKHFDTLIIGHLVPWPTRQNRSSFSIKDTRCLSKTL